MTKRLQEEVSPTSNLVIPDFVQNRTFVVNGNTTDGKAEFIIRELIHNRAKAVTWKRYTVCANEIDLEKYGRIIGKINVIACQNEHTVMQVIFNGQQGITFIYANLRSGSVNIIPSEIQYFPWNVVYKGNVQCLLSPDLSCAVFGLPHSYMSPVKNFKLLLSDILWTGQDLQFQGIRDTRFSFKKYKMIAFDPRKPHHIVLVNINPYCYKCSIEMWDVKDDTCVMCRKIIKTGNATIIADQQIHSANAMLRTAEHSSDIQLLQTHMIYSRAGKYLIISCLGTLIDFEVPQVRVIIMDADSFHVVNNVCFLLESDQLLPNLFVSSVDETDTKVIIWSQIRERPALKIGEVDLPAATTLQDTCKRVILASCAPSDVDKLPLPNKLIRMLQFKFAF